MTNKIVITVDEFREVFPEFADETKYPDAVIQSFIIQAECYISPDNNPAWMLNGESRRLAIMLLVAHLLILNNKALSGSGAAGGTVASKSAGSVSVSFVAPTNKNELDFWLNQTGYGQRLLALLQVKVPASGLYIGGSQRILE